MASTRSSAPARGWPSAPAPTSHPPASPARPHKSCLRSSRRRRRTSRLRSPSRPAPRRAGSRTPTSSRRCHRPMAKVQGSPRSPARPRPRSRRPACRPRLLGSPCRRRSRHRRNRPRPLGSGTPRRLRLLSGTRTPSWPDRPRCPRRWSLRRRSRRPSCHVPASARASPPPPPRSSRGPRHRASGPCPWPRAAAPSPSIRPAPTTPPPPGRAGRPANAARRAPRRCPATPGSEASPPGVPSSPR
mmetsp:Transcript_184301/g.584460  ORF Transcript_184301/g.584460 Transcript_184301/m.584460 type:complete len:244 (-) Transcript_184301:2404-3135(-)